MFEIDGDAILAVKEVNTLTQTAIVRTYYTWALHIHASYQDGVLTAEYRRPIIEGTEWHGQVVEDGRPMLYSVDDGDPVEFSETVALNLPPGKHRIFVYADFGCEPCTLEVDIPGSA